MDKEKAGWLLFVGGAAALGSFLTRQSLNQAWRLAYKEDPPQDPSAWDVEWKDAELFVRQKVCVFDSPLRGKGLLMIIGGIWIIVYYRLITE